MNICDEFPIFMEVPLLLCTQSCQPCQVRSLRLGSRPCTLGPFALPSRRGTAEFSPVCHRQPMGAGWKPWPEILDFGIKNDDFPSKTMKKW